MFCNTFIIIEYITTDKPAHDILKQINEFAFNLQSLIII